MINVVIPIAGKAQRFINEGFTAPKPLIMVKDKPMIDWAMDSFDSTDCRLIFCVRKDHVNNHSIDKILRDKYGQHVEIVVVNKITRGTLSTCLLARDIIDVDEPMFIYTPDVHFQPTFSPSVVASRPDIDGYLLTFKANSPLHSYVQKDADGRVTRTAEKEVISGEAAVGVYYFRTGGMFIKYADEMELGGITTNGEFYICPMYNLMIRDGMDVRTKMTEKMHVLGTPEELTFFTDNTLRRFGVKPVALCADHSGFPEKEMAKDALEQANIQYIDFGTYTAADCDHHDFLFPAIRAMNHGDCDFGMAFCRTGQGFNMAANKAGVRSALVFDEYTAEMSIRHNCANFFSIPSRYVDRTIFRRIVDVLSNTSFDGGRHMTRIQKALGNV